MNTDAHYEIGHSHIKCDDYAISGTIDNVAYAIVSDGCTGSSSAHVDVGSRLLCLIARDTIIYLTRVGKFKGDEYRYMQRDQIFTIIEQLIVRKIIEIKTLMALSADTFDATLMIAIAVETDKGSKDCHYIGWGDGTFITRYADGVYHIMSFEYSPNQPYYLSYAISPSKNDSYIDSMKEGRVVCLEMFDGIEMSDNRYGLRYWKDREDDIGFGYKFHRKVNVTNPETGDKDYKPVQLIVCSDGISSFQYDPKSDEYQQNPRVFPVRTMYPEATGFKILNGPFVQRRMTRMALLNSRKRIVHMDDFAMAAISLE